ECSRIEFAERGSDGDVFRFVREVDVLFQTGLEFLELIEDLVDIDEAEKRFHEVGCRAVVPTHRPNPHRHSARAAAPKSPLWRKSAYTLNLLYARTSNGIALVEKLKTSPRSL